MNRSLKKTGSKLKTSILVFIDDSGDPGFNILKGASANFVIACVIFNDELVAEETALAIKKYRREIGFPDTVEFKFAKSRNEIKKGFLKVVNKFDFDVRAIVVDKKKIRSDELKKSKDSFYNYFIKQVLLHNKGTLMNSKIRLDGHGDRHFRRNLTTYLRRELNSRETKVMKNMRLVDSKQNVLIQMADMIAGAIRRSYDVNKKENKVYRRVVESKIKDCWEFK
jgi:hypothetical protein